MEKFYGDLIFVVLFEVMFCKGFGMVVLFMYVVMN